MAAITPGDIIDWAGNITTLQWIVPGFDNRTEDNLGFGRGRLRQGYFILLPRRLPGPLDFEFDGTTLRSGGRLGLPAETDEADALRRRVHDQVRDERGEAGYRELQRRALSQMRNEGPSRLAKVLPAIRHDDDLRPRDQYPMGGGGLQWKLVRPVSFLVAAEITPNRIALLADGREIDLQSGGYEARATLRRYMEMV